MKNSLVIISSIFRVKKILAFLVLFCLVFLNVPRDLTHECDQESDNHEHSQKSNHQDSFSAEDCFSCEFDLDSAHILDFYLPRYTPILNTVLVEIVNIQHVKSQFGVFSLRGPPVV